MAAGAPDMGALLTEQLMSAAKVVEEQIDQEMHKMDNLDEDGLEAIRRKRMEAMKRAQEKKAEWRANGHGEYSEIPEEKEFFEVTKKSENVVVHFYKDDTFRCKIFDKHLEILAHKHLETKFCKINVLKAPFLTERLRIKVIPTLALIKDAKTRDYIVGFTDLGNTDEFSTEMLEWRLGCSELLNYAGDLMSPPDKEKDAKKSVKTGGGKSVAGSIFGRAAANSKTIKGGTRDSDSSDENDW